MQAKASDICWEFPDDRIGTKSTSPNNSDDEDDEIMAFLARSNAPAHCVESGRMDESSDRNPQNIPKTDGQNVGRTGISGLDDDCDSEDEDDDVLDFISSAKSRPAIDEESLGLSSRPRQQQFTSHNQTDARNIELDANSGGGIQVHEFDLYLPFENSPMAVPYVPSFESFLCMQSLAH
jgi:hypothetical protein